MPALARYSPARLKAAPQRSVRPAKATRPALRAVPKQRARVPAWTTDVTDVAGQPKESKPPRMVLVELRYIASKACRVEVAASSADSFLIVENPYIRRIKT